MSYMKQQHCKMNFVVSMRKFKFCKVESIYINYLHQCERFYKIPIKKQLLDFLELRSAKPLSSILPAKCIF